MNETRLAQLLDDATRPEPPMGPVVTASMRAGDRLRWRRRISATATTTAVTALVVSAFAVAVSYRPAPAAPAVVHRAGVAIIETSLHSVIAVNLATGRQSRPIRVPIGLGALLYGPSIVSAPGGRTVWVVSSTELTPISTRTDRAGPPIRLNTRDATTAVILAGGTRAYVALNTGGVLVVDLTTRKVLTEVKVPACAYMILSPDGKLIYAYTVKGIAVITTTLNVVVETFPLPISPFKISVAPDSTTAYAFVERFASVSHLRPKGWITQVERINAATGATRMITIRNSEAAALAPDGSRLYAAGQGALYAVSPVSGKTVRRWPLPLRSVSALAIGHDGTVLAFGYGLGRTSGPALVIMNLRTAHVERLVHLPYSISSDPILELVVHPPEIFPEVVQDMQVSPDGRTVYVEVLKANPAGAYAMAVAVGSGAVVASTAVEIEMDYNVAFGR